jgi:cytochrome c oxidase assembly protein subunit 15
VRAPFKKSECLSTNNLRFFFSKPPTSPPPTSFSSLSALRARFFKLNRASPVSLRLRSVSSSNGATASDGPLPESEQSLPRLSHPVVSKHLVFIAGLVFAIVVVGGLTRLTESGLSITEWQLVTGLFPPLNDQAWQAELDKYLETPEGRL